ncbi:MAG: hypothetical protein Q8O25_00915, partial [Sulfurisoma sp.]|nr:hypothetical protein [Sulfurisoma sp.]
KKPQDAVRPELVEGQCWRGTSGSTSSPRTATGLLKRNTTCVKEIPINDYSEKGLEKGTVPG